MTFLTGLALSTFLAASTADGVTTHLARARGAVESNPLLQHEAVLIGVKAGAGALTSVAVAKWEKQHPTATRVLLCVGSGVYTGIAWHNLRVQR